MNLVLSFFSGTAYYYRYLEADDLFATYASKILSTKGGSHFFNNTIQKVEKYKIIVFYWATLGNLYFIKMVAQSAARDSLAHL